MAKYARTEGCLSHASRAQCDVLNTTVLTQNISSFLSLCDHGYLAQTCNQMKRFLAAPHSYTPNVSLTRKSPFSRVLGRHTKTVHCLCTCTRTHCDLWVLFWKLMQVRNLRPVELQMQCLANVKDSVHYTANDAIWFNCLPSEKWLSFCQNLQSLHIETTLVR
jgi:hypothetical protein